MAQSVRADKEGGWGVGFGLVGLYLRSTFTFQLLSLETS